MKEQLYKYILSLGDNSMILGHRLSELCGHGPNLETDIALTNISLDLFGQVRNYFQYAASLKEDEEASEDSIAFLRYPNEYRNVLLVEQPNTDFAYVIARQFLFDAFHRPFLEGLSQSNDETLVAIAKKSLKEVQYHLRFSSQWMKRLGDGTEESSRRIQAAVDYLWPYVGELFAVGELETEMMGYGIAPDMEVVQAETMQIIGQTFAEAKIIQPESPWTQSGGKTGVHTEHLGFILADLQYMQRTYPQMTW
ncbi:MAG: 1,2-phenylacetyl-CoA epoxidase subunit PaaC [Bacteroidota bacterium]